MADGPLSELGEAIVCELDFRESPLARIKMQCALKDIAYSGDE
jgi:hypothetical protein